MAFLLAASSAACSQDTLYTYMPSMTDTTRSAIAGPAHNPIKSQFKAKAVPNDIGTPICITMSVGFYAIVLSTN